MQKDLGRNQFDPKRPVKLCECGDHAWVPLTKGFVALVSPEDADFVGQWNWSATIGGGGMVRAVRHEKQPQRTVYMHREIMLPYGSKVVDHVHSDGTDNRRPKLRVCWQGQNLVNRRLEKHKKPGTFKGVWFDKARGKYQAYITKTRQRYNLGRFSEAREAAEAYDREAIRLFGEFARTNKSLGLL